MPMMFLLMLLAAATPEWRAPGDGAVSIEHADAAPAAWKVVSTRTDEFSVESVARLPARGGETFEVQLPVLLDTATTGHPELVSYDRSGHEIKGPVPPIGGFIPTKWITFRPVFAALPGAASVRARFHGKGKGQIQLGALSVRRVKINTYETGALLARPHPATRKSGVYLEANHGVVNAKEIITPEDRDGDGRWALITVDLDELSKPPTDRGGDWRGGFRFDPNQIYWSDGAVLKSDSVLADRTPDASRALHFRMKAHRGPYRVFLGDPGRSVAVSLDGRTWKRYEGGSQPDLGVQPLADGILELWIDACYRDPISPGPVYFDHVTLQLQDDPAEVERIFAAAKRTVRLATQPTRVSRTVPITVEIPGTPMPWPVGTGLPVPRGELGSADDVAVVDGTGRKVPSQIRTQATWPDGSVKWLFVDFLHDPKRAPQGHYAVTYGPGVRPAAGKEAVQIREDSSAITVKTGAVEFRVSKERFGIIQQVRLADGRVVHDEPLSMVVTEKGGRQWRALDLPVTRAVVEHAGPLHAVILVETKLAESGKPASGFHHRARIHAYAASPLVQLDTFVANTDERSKVMVDSITLTMKSSTPIAGAGAIIVRDASQRLDGWVALGGTTPVQVGLQHFWQTFPKALRWGKQGAEIALWAPEGGTYEWFQGVGKTHHISFLYGAQPKGKGPPDRALLVNGPLMGLAPPEWYSTSGALGPLESAAQNGLPDIEKTFVDTITSSVIAKTGLGFENYGDFNSSGYVKGFPLWLDNEYDPPAASMVHFARTGDRAALRFGLASAEHYLDVDMFHYSRARADWANVQHTHSHGTFGHHTADGPNMQHAGYTRGLILHSYFLGETTGIAGTRGIADWVLRASGPNMVAMERVIGHPLMTLNDAYEATWDDKYLRGGARLVGFALKWQDPVRGGFLAPIAEKAAFLSGSPFNGGLISVALLQFNGLARLPELDRALEHNGRWLLTDMWLAPDKIRFKGGVAENGNPQHISTHTRLMRALYEQTKDPFYFVVPWKSVLARFAGGGPAISARESGLLLNYLPWFLATAKELGNPRPDSHLTAAAPEGQVELTAGGAASVCFTLANGGADDVTNLRVSFATRQDFTVAKVTSPPPSLPAKSETRLCYEVRAPERINATSAMNRVAYGHFSALYQRGGKSHFLHSWATLEIQ